MMTFAGMTRVRLWRRDVAEVPAAQLCRLRMQGIAQVINKNLQHSFAFMKIAICL